MAFKKKLGLYVSDKCKNAVLNGKPWFEFRCFIRTYWMLLSSYTLIISDNTAAILREIAGDIKASQGIEPWWDLEVCDNSRALAIKLQAVTKEEVERILLFLDPDKLDAELVTLWILREAIVEHGQKLNINWGAALWAQREWASACGYQQRLEIGPNDAIAFVGENAGIAIEQFALKHSKTVMLFPYRILTSSTGAYMAASQSPASWPSGLITNHSDELLAVASIISKHYFNGSRCGVRGKLCHVIACAGSHREQPHGMMMMKQFLEVCADPRMRVNLMLNRPTAAEWIHQFEYPPSKGFEYPQSKGIVV